ncbi:reverse transcriptase [Phytophthora cinnamomi]|uniref:reverse transcriptase n=1 Tax=Phytophthora cinnamomi TaxID=4785 RepID=UPI00355A36C5|nr:reverse transcriptase [Phytophthora cinnamomi]
MSVQVSILNASSSGVSDSVPSVIGPSGTSNFSAYSSSHQAQTSRDSSSALSLMSLGHSASAHMGSVPGHLVMSVQAGGALVATPDAGMSVTRTFIPASRRALPNQEDVDMAAVESTDARSSRTASKCRVSKSRSEMKPERLEPAHSKSGLTSDGCQRSSVSSRREYSSRNRFSRTGVSLRSGSRSSSASSGAAQVALNVMRKLQEQQAAFRARLNQAQLDMRLEVQRELQSANEQVRAMKEQMASAQ